MSDPSDQPTEVTLLLRRAGQGETGAFDRLFPLIYDELKHLAEARLKVERDDHTLSATALVHEAYLRLVGQTEVEWQSRTHFFAVAAQAMRRILVDHARRRGAGKRAAGARAVPLELAENVAGHDWPGAGDDAEPLLVLDAALERLSRFNPRGARVIEYRFFGGLPFGEIAEVLGLSEVTTRRAWTMAKTWLRREMAAGLTA
jgi:RNA polymerase sigma factor (TIGR02999 family)